MKFFEHCFAVTGIGPFPLDMLRYEHAFPASETDSVHIARDGLPHERTVWLRRRGANKNWQPEWERWKSFRWEVVETSLTSIILGPL